MDSYQPKSLPEYRVLPDGTVMEYLASGFGIEGRPIVAARREGYWEPLHFDVEEWKKLKDCSRWRTIYLQKLHHTTSKLGWLWRKAT